MDAVSASPQRQEAISGVDAIPKQPPADPSVQACLRLSELQRVRMFCITSQSRCDRSMGSALARCLGYDVSGEEAARKAVFKQAASIRTSTEKAFNESLKKTGDFERAVLDAVASIQLGFQSDDPRLLSLTDFLPIIPLSASSRSIWDRHREGTEKKMRHIASSLPVFEWVKTNAKGVGDLGLARLIGEAPLIYLYATHERLWKRLGLAVVGEERQQRKGTAEEAMLHGFSPRRRAEAWSVLSDTMFRQQWRGTDPDNPESGGMPIGPYGEVYRARKAHTLPRISETDSLPFTDRRKWTKKRCDNDARRVMGKEFLRDLWRVWHGKEARHPSRFAVRGQEAA